MPLFVRGSRGVRLTPAGETLLEDARDLLERSDRLGESVEQLRRGASRTLKVGVAPGVPAHLLPDVVAPLRARARGTGGRAGTRNTRADRSALDASVDARYE